MVSCGSSPRMRGTLPLPGQSWSTIRFIPAHAGNSSIHPHYPMGRFIPAHAGNSSSIISLSKVTTVHPRACGELIAGPDYSVLSSTQDSMESGSSPRMRGTHGDRLRLANSQRFIPAHAGNSATAVTYLELLDGSSPRMRGTPHPRSRLRRPDSVHPRACGELQSRARDLAVPAGSSPRMRGTLFLETHDSKRFARP